MNMEDFNMEDFPEMPSFNDSFNLEEFEAGNMTADLQNFEDVNSDGKFKNASSKTNKCKSLRGKQGLTKTMFLRKPVPRRTKNLVTMKISRARMRAMDL